VMLHLRPKVGEAVDCGLNKMILDLSQVERADITLIKLGFSVIQLCRELSLRMRVLASGPVMDECRNYEETKEWPFAATLEDALAALSRQEGAAT